MNTWQKINREHYEYLKKWNSLSQKEKVKSMRENKEFWDDLFNDSKIEDKIYKIDNLSEIRLDNAISHDSLPIPLKI